MTDALRLGTRRSKLAMAQSGQIAEAVRQITGRPVELVEITTYGDTSREHLAQIGGTGVFVTALRDALLSGEVDFAVHSLKDLPTAEPDDLVLAAIPVREDPRDVLVARDGLTFEQLPDGARVGTGSPRRMAQLNAYARNHGMRIETVPIRGNIDTRIGFVRSGELDAVVLAAAGLHRVGRAGEVTEYLPVDIILPAPGQGPWRSSARHPALISPPSSRSSTTRTPGPPSPPSDPCSPPWRPVAVRLLAHWPTSWPTGRLSPRCACAASSARPTAPRWCSCPPPVPYPRRTKATRRSDANSRPRCWPRVRPVLWGSEHDEPHLVEPASRPSRAWARHLPRCRTRGSGTSHTARCRSARECGRTDRRAARARRRTQPCESDRKHASADGC